MHVEQISLPYRDTVSAEISYFHDYGQEENESKKISIETKRSLKGQNSTRMAILSQNQI